jgi:hypothetical protein
MTVALSNLAEFDILIANDGRHKELFFATLAGEISPEEFFRREEKLLEELSRKLVASKCSLKGVC